MPFEQNSEPHLDEYLQFIADSINRIDEPYFMVKSNQKPKSIYRERVFCYELYHQLRLSINLPDNERLKAYFKDKGIVWNGEIDKKGNNHFKKQNPDFILHSQGNHDFNKLVIEVKCSKGYKKDFDTLKYFINNPKNPDYSYNIGVFVVFGVYSAIAEFVKKEKTQLKNILSVEEQKRIYLFFAPSAKRILPYRNLFIAIQEHDV